jgi:hypothetical protein
MVDRVKPLKLESVETGGTQDDAFPTSVNKNEDFYDGRGITLQDESSDDDHVRIFRAPSGDMMFRDLVVPGVEHTLTELLNSSFAGQVQEVPFTNAPILSINHQRHYHPLVQVIIEQQSGWNLGGWGLIDWNLGLGSYVRLPDDQYVTTHETSDMFWVEFTAPLTGRVLYY